MSAANRGARNLRLAASIAVWGGLALILVATLYMASFLAGQPQDVAHDRPAAQDESLPAVIADQPSAPGPTSAKDSAADEPSDRAAASQRRSEAGHVAGDYEAGDHVAGGYAEDEHAEATHTAARVENVTIRDREGRIEFQGTVDLAPTLVRIERGQRLRFAHDGARFQNRERQLPHKPAGYYREFVHPTPGVEGPGAQRVILGRQGEIYYTPDHYRTFRRIK